MTLSNLINNIGVSAVTCLKLDIEGMEYPALKGMRQTLQAYHPRLSIEMHGADSEEKAEGAGRVVTFLEEVGYRIRHIESGEEINRNNAARASEGHLYCEPE